MKNLLLPYHIWFTRILGMPLNSFYSAFKIVEENGAMKINNLSYGKDKKHVMDVFLPKNHSSENPLVVLVHGGGWKFGRKEHMMMIRDFLFRNNIPSASINYRLLKKDLTYKNQLEDISNAIEKLNSFAVDWNLKPNHYIILGESAGAHLALLYGYQNPEKIKKLISLGGPTDFYSENYQNLFYSKLISKALYFVVGEKFDRKNLSEKFKEASPIYHISNVPTLIFQGGIDPLVNKQQGFALDAALSKKNILHQFVFMKNAGHFPRFFNKNLRNTVILPHILNWIKN